MKSLARGFLCIALLSWAAPALARGGDPPKRYTRPALREEILRMLDEDQALRKYLIEHPQDAKAQVRLQAEDEGRTRRVVAILKGKGWPRTREVGPEACGAVWTILQHSDDATLAWSLPFMNKAAKSGDLEWGLVATSTDRVLVNQGKEQLYGTQFEEKGEKLVPYPIEDAAGLDARRERVGLGPFDEYIRLIGETYREPAAQGGSEGGKAALKPSGPTPALLPSAPQSDERWEPIEALKKNAPPLAERFERAIHTNKLGETMPYRLFRPKAEAGKKYPLVLFLHGSSGSGADNERQLQKANMFGALVWALPENQKAHPCFILAPQSEVNWPPVRLIPDHLPEILPGLGAGARQAVEILEDLLEKEPIDRTRIYVTGHSMGAAGIWNLLSQRPDLFAAGVPVAGRANLQEIGAAAKIPIWNFHGVKDDVEPVESSRAALAALQAAGGKPLYTEYPDVEHNSFLWAYTEPALVGWLFAQRRAP